MGLFIEPAAFLDSGWDGASQLIFLFVAYGYLLFVGASLVRPFTLVLPYHDDTTPYTPPPLPSPTNQ